MPTLSSLLLHSLLAGSPMSTPEGVPLHWPRENAAPVYLPLVGDSTSATTALGASTFSDAVVGGFSRWAWAMNGHLRFDYWQDGPYDAYTTAFARDGLSTIAFASQSAGAEKLSTTSVAYTELWTDSSGQITEVDIVLNDLTFQFVSADGPQTSLPDYLDPTDRRVVLEDVITHELGHALGLGHSDEIDATMFTFGWSAQRDLSCDDVAGVRAHYSISNADTGTVIGRVVAPSGTPILGAHVRLISADHPDVRPSGLSRKDGSFEISGVPSGRYLVGVAPWKAGVRSLSPYYHALDHAICPSGAFARTFLTRDGGTRLALFDVGGQTTTDVSSILVACSESGGMVTPSLGTSESPTAPIVQPDPNEDGGRVAFVDAGIPTMQGNERWYKLVVPEPGLRVRVLSYSLHSSLEPRLRLLDSALMPVAIQLSQPLAQPTPDRNFTNYDAQLTAADLPAGTYYLAIESSRVPDSEFAYPQFYLDADPFFVVLVAVGTAVPTAGTQPRCTPRMTDLAPYMEPSEGPPLPANDASSASRGCQIDPETPRGTIPPWVVMGPLCIAYVRCRSRRRLAE
ncbi:MAG: M57 family metalloprotease [Nannocystaceae bacterium]